MIVVFLAAMALFPSSTDPNLSLFVAIEGGDAPLALPCVEARRRGDVPLIEAGCATLWIEVVDSARRPALRTKVADELHANLFAFHGANRDYSWDIRKGGATTWRFSSRPIRYYYDLRRGERYFARAIYWNVADVRPVKMVSPWTSFAIPKR